MSAAPLTTDSLADAREETCRLLQSVIHYCRCTQLHLEVGDDPVAVYDITTTKHYFDSAIRSFEPVRASFRQRIDKAEGAAVG